MDARKLLDISLIVAVQYGIVAIMYAVILRYRLPYLPTLAIYAGLSLLPALYRSTLGEIIEKGSPFPPGMTYSEVALTLVFITLIPSLAVIGIALYRFSPLEALLLPFIGLIASTLFGTALKHL